MTSDQQDSRRTSLLLSPVIATAEAVEAILREGRRIHWLLAAVSLIVAWYVYVPIHELLHALGCVATGGSVTTLEIQTQYGGALLAEVFPFVQAGGEYAGQLSDFDTHGSDLVYLATDALPFVLSILLGVPLLRACGLASRPLLLGPAIVLALAPFYSLTGDYYEMGSILVTRAVGEAWYPLRSDDVFTVMRGLWSMPEAVFIATGSLLVAAGLAYATWDVGDRLARRLVKPPQAQ